MTIPERLPLAVVFLTWFRHRRTTEIASHLGIPLLELTTSRRGISRYAELTARTAGTLFRIRPRVVIVQSPSLVLSIVALALRPFLRYRLLVDAHNEAVEPYLNTSRLVRGLTDWVLRKADNIIVTNDPLARKVRERNGKPLVLFDRIPATPSLAARSRAENFHAVVISTFAGDEPIAVILEAAREIGATVTFSMTGNSAKMPQQLRKLVPPNVTLTGFLDEPDYWSLLATCDVVIDLTTMEDCLVCGAYEALSVGTPLILSSNQASLQLFHDAALFTDNTAASLVAAIRQSMQERGALKAQSISARARIDRLWDTCAAQVMATMRGLANPSNPADR